MCISCRNAAERLLLCLADQLGASNSRRFRNCSNFAGVFRNRNLLPCGGRLKRLSTEGINADYRMAVFYLGLRNDGSAVALREVWSRWPVYIQEGHAILDPLFHYSNDSAKWRHTHGGVPKLPYPLSGKGGRRGCIKDRLPSVLFIGSYTRPRTLFLERLRCALARTLWDAS